MGLYGSWVISFTASAYDEPVVDHSNFAVVAIIFVMALIEVFLAIMGTFASNERNSTYMQVQYVDLCACFNVVLSSLNLHFLNCDYTVRCKLLFSSDGVTYK